MNFPSVSNFNYSSHAQMQAAGILRTPQQVASNLSNSVQNNSVQSNSTADNSDAAPADNNRLRAHHTEETQSQADSSRKQNAAATDAQILQEQKVIAELAARDREVRAHEQAHAAVGGVYAGAPQYTYEHGPNGKKYAVAGEVSISVSPIEGDPEATIQKADQVRRAALAPAEPSTQDRAVAAQATQMKLDAQMELQQVKQEEQQEQGDQSERAGRLSNRLAEALMTSDALENRSSESVNVLV